jgi:hypothetical protein
MADEIARDRAAEPRAHQVAPADRNAGSAPIGMSAFAAKPENICSVRVLRLVTPTRDSECAPQQSTKC